MDEQYLTTGQASKMLKVSPRTVCNWFDNGVISGYRMPGGGDRRISMSSLRSMSKSTGMPLSDVPARRSK